MKKLSLFLIPLCVFSVSACSSVTNTYGKINSGYRNYAWCTSKEYVENSGVLLPVVIEDKITSVDNSIDTPIGRLGFKLMNPPSVTYNFFKDKLYEIILEIEDNRITEAVYNEFIESCIEEYGDDYSNIPVRKEDDVDFSFAGASWIDEENGNEVSVYWSSFAHEDKVIAEYLDKSTLRVTYKNDKLKKQLGVKESKK